MNLLRTEILCFFTSVALLSPAAALAQLGTDIYSQEARKIVERLAGTKVAGDHPLVIEAADALRRGDRLAAARAGTKHPNFLSSTVKLMALRLSTRDETMSLLLNDFAASFIGVTRDNIDARELLTGNFYYAGDPNRYLAQRSVGLTAAQISELSPLPPESDIKFVNSNDHYRALENTKVKPAIGLPVSSDMLFTN